MVPFLSIDLLMCMWVASASWLLWRMLLQWAWVCRYVFEILFSVLFGICPEVGLLGHVAFLFLLYWGTSLLFSIVPTPFYIPTHCTRVPISSHPHQHLQLSGFFFFLIVFILMGELWHLWFWFAVLLVTSNAEHLSIWLVAILFIFFGEMFVQFLWPFLKIRLFGFLLLLLNCSSLTPYEIHD